MDAMGTVCMSVIGIPAPAPTTVERRRRWTANPTASTAQTTNRTTNTTIQSISACFFPACELWPLLGVGSCDGAMEVGHAAPQSNPAVLVPCAPVGVCLGEGLAVAVAGDKNAMAVVVVVDSGVWVDSVAVWVVVVTVAIGVI